jgi:hypothetical protein
MRRRLKRLELRKPEQDDFRVFFVQGGYEGDDARAFLRDHGQDVRETDLVVQFVPAKDGQHLYTQMELASNHWWLLIKAITGEPAIMACAVVAVVGMAGSLRPTLGRMTDACLAGSRDVGRRI